MASSPTTQAPRRSSSLPVGRPPSTSPDPQIEILFTLPSVRIISFITSSKSTSRPGSSNGPADIEEEPGTLSWVSRFERTIAVGPLRIYRAPGSVAFLNCANALRPILPKSQAWCVDGNSKFVLQIRPPQYWRIEVPHKTLDEIIMIEDLKKVLEQVLRYEKTACPFKRDFVVELPEKPATPVKKRPWRPVEKPPGGPPPKSSPLLQASAPYDSYAIVPLPESRPSTPCPSSELSAPPGRPTSQAEPHRDLESPAGTSISEIRQAIEAVKMPNLSGITMPEPLDRPREPEPADLRPLQPYLLDTPDSEYIFGSYAGTDEESDSYSDATDDTNLTPRSGRKPHLYQVVESESDNVGKPQSIQNCNRSVTAPPILSLITSPPSKQRTKSPLRCSTTFETSSDCSSSVESFHSVQSWHSPLAPPSPPASEPSSPTSTYRYPHENIVLSKRPIHSRDISELTVTPETPKMWDRNTISHERSNARSLSPPPRTPPTLVHDGSEKSDEEHFEFATPPTIKPTVRHRATTSSNSRRRALSPLPAAVNLFSPPKQAQRRLRTARHLPTAIIQKTCEILLSPPSHIFQLMLSIASKIAAGEWRGMLSGYGEAVHWDFEDEYGPDPSLYEDDYGMSLAKPRISQEIASKSSTNITGGSWEVD
ncbi:hypothetical protein ONS95_006707 [Cadophora gregata]|uniref:uncharacterized protein n=1 Tax=Cadophora gregata TaxID=51156 RepID=UPI0026DD2982|nr:uncharacterized protein ONS95_006707 [Cadophora gregata]KAK0101540.1 hypothetical protein ONS95_006707 [Cadophora gregata]KAK0106445.1 hypothetical protein ONS96_004074 [Cadophora gregata f. sp. sojae]